MNGRQHKRRERSWFRERTDLGGIVLIDAIVASVMILIILLPIGTMLASADRNQQNDLNLLSDQKVATGEVSQLLSTIAQNAAGPGDTCSSGYYTNPGVTNIACPGATTSITWPSITSTGASTLTQDGITFHVVAVGGWCALTSNVWQNGTPASNQPMSFFVAVQVSQGSGDVYRRSTDYSVVPGSATWTSIPTSTSSSTVYQCPLGGGSPNVTGLT